MDGASIRSFYRTNSSIFFCQPTILEVAVVESVVEVPEKKEHNK